MRATTLPLATAVAALTAALILVAGCSDDDNGGKSRAAADDTALPERTSPPPPIPSAARPTATACQPTPGEEGSRGLRDGPAEASADTPARVRLGPGRDVEATRAADETGWRDGEPLLVTGVIYTEGCRRPLAGATIEAWQTNAAGHYGPLPEDSSERICCYLYGVARTDSSGRYAFDTVVPGRYDEQVAPPRHVHFTIGHPEATGLTTEVMIAGDPGTEGEPLAAPLTGPKDARVITFDIVLRGG